MGDTGCARRAQLSMQEELPCVPGHLERRGCPRAPLHHDTLPAPFIINLHLKAGSCANH